MAETQPAFSADRLTGIVGILPSLSTPDAGSWSCEQSVATDETTRLVGLLKACGIDLLMTGGSFGEGASLTEAEHAVLTETVARALDGTGALFAGATTLNTRETIARARCLVDCGATGLFLGRPMWMSLDPGAIVDFYRDVAAALPGVPIIVYDNQFAFKAPISVETYRDLAAIPEIIATKHIGGPSLPATVEAVGDRIKVLPVDSQWGALARAYPDRVTACWTGNAADGPEPLATLAAAVAAKDYDRAEAIGERMAWAQAPMFPGGKIENFVDYNIPIAHARLEGSRLVTSGPPRPPYTAAPADYLEGGRETGRRWAALRREIDEGGGAISR